MIKSSNGFALANRRDYTGNTPVATHILVKTVKIIISTQKCSDTTGNRTLAGVGDSVTEQKKTVFKTIR